MEDEEEEEEEVILEEENMEAEPQIKLKGAVEEADVAPGASRPAGTPQPPDEEQAGLELLFFQNQEFFISHTLIARDLICPLHLQVPVV